MYKIFTLFILCFVASNSYCQTINSKQVAQIKPFVLGVIDELQSTILSEKRILNIYLPEGYNQNDAKKFPVIYLLDGSAEEDFIHIVGLVQFNSFEWINQIPKSIVVVIATVDRRRDFTFPTTINEDALKYPTNGHSNQFIAFIEKELQPYIESKYKISSDKMIIGESLGGLLATEILLTKPALFNKYIIVSPSLWWNNGSLLSQNATALSESIDHQTDIYIGVGKEGLTPTTIPRVMEVDANLLAEKIRGVKNKKLNVLFDYLPQEDHATIMHQAVFNAFKLLNPLKQKEQKK
jgi:hypothetical protein